MTSSEASSSEAEQCAEDIEVEQITSANGNKNIQVDSKEVNAIQFLRTIQIHNLLIAGCIFKEILSSSSSAEESDPNEDEEHKSNPSIENQIQTEIHSHTNSEHQNTSSTTDQTRANEVL